MKRVRAIGWIGMAALLAAGCATSFGAKAKETESLNAQVASLEGQIGTLNQRIEDLSQRQGSLEAQVTTRQPSQTQAAVRAKATALSTRQVQVALKAAGFYNGSVDGKPGPKTKEALRAFQRSNGLSPDGVVGVKTAIQLAKFLESGTRAKE
ncbi:MAG: peptidoglycan-binding protein [Candidatus Omnitrophica bacterium]|nr:peptidoglycan-binding protein [Candidatus Omnitrophota bacterium]